MWCAVSACGGTVVERNDNGDGGSAGTGEVPPVGGVSGSGVSGIGGGGGPVAYGGASGVGGSLGVGGAGVGGSSGAGSDGAVGSGGWITCGRARCSSIEVPPTLPHFPPCCPQPGPGDPPGAGCGIDVSAFGMLGVHFEPSCQRRNQPGFPDPTCPGTTFNPWAARPTYQAGCCRADAGVCGYQLDVAGDMQMDLGCVSTAAFTSTPPIPCGPSIRPNWFSCLCGESSVKVQFCLAVDCTVSAVNNDICNAACAERGGSHGWSCELASPTCR